MTKHPLAPTKEDYEKAIATYEKFFNYIKNYLNSGKEDCIFFCL